MVFNVTSPRPNARKRDAAPRFRFVMPDRGAIRFNGKPSTVRRTGLFKAITRWLFIFLRTVGAAAAHSFQFLDCQVTHFSHSSFCGISRAPFSFSQVWRHQVHAPANSAATI
jgi:hypothetical protein